MSIPTTGETYSKIIEHLRKLQEEAATMAHLASANNDYRLSKAWLQISENFKSMQYQLTQLATKGLQ